MEWSKIEWTHHTCNFWYGCTKVSAGCLKCYAEAQMDTRYGLVGWGADHPRRRTGRNSWREPFRWDRDAAAVGEHRRVFTLSLGDFWDNDVDPSWRSDAFDVIAQCQNLVWLILTKRPQNIGKMLPTDWEEGYPNVWLGSTVENMIEARRRIPILLDVPARRHFLSCEPMLEDLDLKRWLGRGVDSVIAGGETLPGTRLMEPDWARNLRDQSHKAGIAFFLKQMTRKAEIPGDLLIREFP